MDVADRNHHGAVGYTTVTTGVTTGRSAEGGRRGTLLTSSGNKSTPSFVLLHKAETPSLVLGEGPEQQP